MSTPERQPILFLEVSLSSKDTVKLVVYEGDIIENVVDEFA